MTDEKRRSIMQDVLSRIPNEWRDDLEIVEIGALAKHNGRPVGTPYVDISARTRLGQMQAALSLTSYVENVPTEWKWRPYQGQKTVVRLFKPSSDRVKPNVFELEAQDS